ncbi:sugar nucleotide-binding protein [Rhodobacteraceae bacterium]|nr:sugar nucleotide-binding protein [Paracoccaceae bacterium]
MLKSKWLVVGGTGMLGATIVKELESLGKICFSVSQSSNPYQVNLCDGVQIKKLISEICPNYVINCAAITNGKLCKNSPQLANSINCEAVRHLSFGCNAIGSRFVQISTDAFYCLSQAENNETALDLTFPTEYAKSKYGAELACCSNDLIVRTSFIGRKKNKQSLLDFYIDAIVSKRKIQIYDDVVTSSLDVSSCASIVTKLAKSDATGIFNLGTSKCYLKSKIFFKLLDILGENCPHELVNARDVNGYLGNVKQGMNVNKLETFLETKMPSFEDVMENLREKGYLDDLLQRI